MVVSAEMTLRGPARKSTLLALRDLERRMPERRGCQREVEVRRSEGGRLGLSVNEQNVIVRIVPDTHAASSDLSLGDAVVAVNGEPIGDIWLPTLLEQTGVMEYTFTVETAIAPACSDRTAQQLAPGGATAPAAGADEDAGEGGRAAAPSSRGRPLRRSSPFWETKQAESLPRAAAAQSFDPLVHGQL